MTEASTAINTPGDVLGAPLDDSDFIRPGWSTDFTTLPEWHVGKVYPLAAGATPPALTDPGCYLTAGYIHNTPSPSEPDYVPPGKPYPGFSWLSSELAPYPNGDEIAVDGYNPFSVADGILTITAEPTPASVLPWLPAGYSPAYTSGSLCTYPFSQQYGYFELRGQAPKGDGLWPAFWLMPVDMTWPPEIDVMEILGSQTDVLNTTLHDPSYKTDTSASTQIGYATAAGVDLSEGFHQYGVDWGPTTIRFYLDRKLVFSQPTPANMHKPFYLIANLAVGGPTSWGGAPDETTVFPARFRIASIDAWQRASYVTPD
ncbi:MAG TPA: glycoside hydrolase family 16 protein [Acetobacteraceae bacterium]|nr:glycoside hydrolase family 16 protein [Acetobacteraceae bacterium]